MLSSAFILILKFSFWTAKIPVFQVRSLIFINNDLSEIFSLAKIYFLNNKFCKLKLWNSCFIFPFVNEISCATKKKSISRKEIESCYSNFEKRKTRKKKNEQKLIPKVSYWITSSHSSTRLFLRSLVPLYNFHLEGEAQKSSWK